MSIAKEIPELINAGIISEETGEQIRQYYEKKKDSSANRIFIAFGILGALLVGLGIILIIAHNWDELSRSTKAGLSFLPLILGQALCVFVLIKKRDNRTWSEASATFLFFAVAASISLISQVYNIPGKISSFILSWMLLTLPLVYLLRSSMVSLLYLIGITYYACEKGYWDYPEREPYLYWLLILLVLPHYYRLLKYLPKNNFTLFHHWIITLSVTISLGTMVSEYSQIMYLGYFCLFAVFYQVGLSSYFLHKNVIANSYRTLGTVGTLVLLLILSSNWFWERWRDATVLSEKLFVSPELWTTVILFLLALFGLFINYRQKSWQPFRFETFIFLIFSVLLFAGKFLPFVVVLVNVLVLAYGLVKVREGTLKDHLGILNYGLLTIVALVTIRFFDTDLSFVLRGLMFLVAGAGFFATNYVMLKRRKANEK